MYLGYEMRQEIAYLVKSGQLSCSSYRRLLNYAHLGSMLPDVSDFANFGSILKKKVQTK